MGFGGKKRTNPHRGMRKLKKIQVKDNANPHSHRKMGKLRNVKTKTNAAATRSSPTPAPPENPRTTHTRACFCDSPGARGNDFVRRTWVLHLNFSRIRIGALEAQ
jgi:hypothetical protein